MTVRALDVFSFRESVVNEYKHFATSFTTIYARDIREQVEEIYSTNRYWPEPLIQINPHYKQSTDIQRLVANRVLEPACEQIFQSKDTPLKLYKHQEQAIALAADNESFVVTTGTGSGKSLCFFIPIVNHVLAARRAGSLEGTTAIVIYPMNALANSQREELGKYVSNFKGEKPVTFARYTGQEDEEERQSIADNPPDILLTNFMMLELLMTRQGKVDRQVIENCNGLSFLVLDELHTYTRSNRRQSRSLAPPKRSVLSSNAWAKTFSAEACWNTGMVDALSPALRFPNSCARAILSPGLTAQPMGNVSTCLMVYSSLHILMRYSMQVLSLSVTTEIFLSRAPSTRKHEKYSASLAP